MKYVDIAAVIITFAGLLYLLFALIFHTTFIPPSSPFFGLLLFVMYLSACFCLARLLASRQF